MNADISKLIKRVQQSLDPDARELAARVRDAMAQPDRRVGAALAPSPRGGRAPSAPRVTVTHRDGKHFAEAATDANANLARFEEAFKAAFGTTERVIAEALFNQMLNIVHTDPARPLDPAAANLMLALLHQIGPKDELEAMLTCQMIATHVASMDIARRAFHVEQTATGRAACFSLVRKLMVLFTTQMDALNRHRGKATVQKVVVQKVMIAPGGQAVVGAVSGRGGGG